MPRYKVQIVEYWSVEVEADNEDEAEEMAADIVAEGDGDYEFMDVESIIEI